MIRSWATEHERADRRGRSAVVLGLDQDLVGGDLEPAGLRPGGQPAGRVQRCGSWPSTCQLVPGPFDFLTGDRDDPGRMELARAAAVAARPIGPRGSVAAVGPAVDQVAAPGPVRLKPGQAVIDKAESAGK